jgi:membrane protease YdiL (CAAX protease family)
MGIHDFGQTVARGANVPLVEALRHFLTPFLVGMIALGAIQAMQSLGRLEGEQMLLTSVSTRALVVGLLIEDITEWLLSIGLSLVLAVAAFALGLGAPIMVVVAVLAFVPLFAATLLVGYVLGFLVWLAIRTLPVASSTKRVLEAVLGAIGILAAAGIGAVVGGSSVSGSLLAAVPEGPPTIPIGLYADLFFLGTPLQPPLSPMTGLAALGVLATIPIAFEGLVRLAPRFWYAETRRSISGRSADDSRSIDEEPTRTGRETEGVFRFRTVRIARGFWLRAARAPDRFVHLMYYVMLLGLLVTPILTDPGLATLLLPVTLIVLGMWLAGSAFCLNPLGEDGSMIQELTLTPTSPATFMHARLLAGIALGLPVAVVGVVLFALGSDLGLSLQQVVAGVVVASLLVIVSATFALGIGSFLPRFGTVRLFESVEAPSPSTMAFIIHTVVTSLLALAGSAVVWVVTEGGTSVSPTLQWGSLGALAVGLMIIGDGSRRYAIERLAWFGRSPTDRDRNRVLAAYVALGLTGFGFLVLTAASLSLTVVEPTFATAVDDVSLVVQFLVQYAGYALVALGFIYVTKRGIAYVDIARPTRRDLRYTLGGFGVSIAIWFGFTRLVSWLGVPTSGQSLLEAAANADPTLLLVLIPLVLLVNAPVEELLFRNVIQKSLNESFSRWGAILLGSLCFALVHVPAYYDSNLIAMLTSLIVVFVLGCCWGVIYARTDRLFVPAVAHGAYNAVLIGILYFGMI